VKQKHKNKEKKTVTLLYTLK